MGFPRFFSSLRHRKARKMVVAVDQNGKLAEAVAIETAGETASQIFSFGVAVPTTLSQIFSTAQDNQTAVSLNILAGNSTSANECRSLGYFSHAGILAAPKGVPQIEVTFHVDGEGVLSIMARDLATSKETRIGPHFLKISQDQKEIHGLDGKVCSIKEAKEANYVNLTPGETVPKSGEWKCNICGEGGLIDVLLEGSLKKDKHYKKFKGYVAVKLYKAMLKESSWGREIRKSMDFLNDSQLDGRETIRFFSEGEKFTECPNCRSATGWTLLELSNDIVSKYRGKRYQAEDPQLGVYGPELRNLRDPIRKNNNKTTCYICGNPTTVLFPVIEQYILRNRVRAAETKLPGVKGMLFVPNWARDGAICKHCRGVMCPHCAEEKLGNPLVDIPKCPLCGNMIYGIDHITD